VLKDPFTTIFASLLRLSTAKSKHDDPKMPLPDTEEQAPLLAQTEKPAYGRRGALLLFVVPASMMLFAVLHERSGVTVQGALSANSLQALGTSDWDEDCSVYDDDDVFTADVCGGFDWLVCYNARTACNSSYYCSEFCGDSCSSGAGAVCLYETVSDMKSSCAKLAELRKATGDSHDKTGGDSSSGQGEGYGLHDDLPDEGCGMHAYCEHCTSDCKSAKMSTYLRAKFDMAPWQPNAIKEAVEDMPKLCEYFGY